MMIQCVSFVLLASTATAFLTASRPPASTSTTLALSQILFAPDYYDTYDDENDLHIPNRLAFTTTKWKDLDDAQEAYTMLVESGISFVSCSPGTEKMLAKCMGDVQAMVGTCWSQRFQFGEGSLVSGMESKADVLGDSVQILQARPSKLSLGGLGAIADGIVSSIDEGYCVSGGAIDITSKGKLKALCKTMEQRDEELVSNQFEFNIMSRKNEGMIKACKELGVIPFCRHPLGKDLLASGIWTSEDPRGGNKGMKFSLKVLEKWEPLHSMQYRVADQVQKRATRDSRALKDYRDRRFEDKKNSHKVTAAQVAINYVVAKGGVPLVDVYDEKSAEELLGCLGWHLTEEEVSMLDQAAELSEM